MSTLFNYSHNDFASFLTSFTPSLELNLANANLKQVLEEYTKFKQRTSPRFTNSSIIYNINKMEELFNCTIYPEKINDLFYSYFTKYMLENGVGYSTIENYCCNIRAALNWAARHNCRLSPTYDIFDIPKVENEKIALTPDEISHIYHYDLRLIKCNLQHTKNLQKIKDMFVLSCNLGQRYSDMRRICPSHFSEDKTSFKIVQQKTGSTAKINIETDTIDPKAVRHILEKYHYNAPYKGTIGNYNWYLKELLAHIGEEFDQEIVYEQKINGMVVEKKCLKRELIASHTARRTYCSYWAIDRKRNEIDIRRCTGHKDSRSFCQYLCYNGD